MTIIHLPGLRRKIAAIERKQKTAGNRVGHLLKPAGLKFIQFTGFWNGHTQAFQVAPAPDAGPLVTGGYPIINVIPRPQRVSLTVPAGYDPVTIDVPVMFDCWGSPTRFADAQQIEVDIAKLEWMYGRGIYGGGTQGGAVGVGPPPTVQIATVNNAGVSIPLLSSNYQQIIAGEWGGAQQTSSINSTQLSNGGAINYEITTISWDANPLRVPAGQQYGGCRMRQLATITVQQIVSDPYITTPGTSVKTGGTVSYVTKQGDTFLTIARKQVPGVSATRVTAVAAAIMSTNSSVRGIVRSVNKPQKAGITIRITAADKAA